MFSLKALRNLKTKLSSSRRGEVSNEPARQCLSLVSVEHENLASAFVAEFERDKVVANGPYPFDGVDHRCGFGGLFVAHGFALGGFRADSFARRLHRVEGVLMRLSPFRMFAAASGLALAVMIIAFAVFS